MFDYLAPKLFVICAHMKVNEIEGVVGNVSYIGYRIVVSLRDVINVFDVTISVSGARIRKLSPTKSKKSIIVQLYEEHLPSEITIRISYQKNTFTYTLQHMEKPRVHVMAVVHIPSDSLLESQTYIYYEDLIEMFVGHTLMMGIDEVWIYASEKRPINKSVQERLMETANFEFMLCGLNREEAYRDFFNINMHRTDYMVAMTLDDIIPEPIEKPLLGDIVPIMMGKTCTRMCVNPLTMHGLML